MKEIISTLLLISSFVLFTPLLPVSAVAGTTGTNITVTEFESGCPRGTFRVRKHTSKRTKIKNSILSGAGGLVIGAIAGGKRGALIGAGVGAGSYLTYRYIKDRHGKCVRSYVRG